MTDASPVSSCSPQALVAFRCDACEYTFDAAPDRVEDEPSRAHPYRYFSSCPNCKREVGQAPWQVATLYSMGKHTGPKTVEGRAQSAQNLTGHSTELTRLNALKHGAAAKTAVFFPARPDQYPHCQSCDVDREYCRAQPACIRRTDLTMRYLAAGKNHGNRAAGDP